MNPTQTDDVAAYAAQTGIPAADVLRMAVAEGFLRRAALVGGPFVLKGSHVTRQHLKEGWRRIPGDLDWVGTEALDEGVLTQWATAVTETQLDDGIRFRSFAENAFWRNVDYAMADDFPTVNTDLLAWAAGQRLEIRGMDVSFGLRLQPSPRSLEYQPLFGDRFLLPETCAPELQIAWKLHQCLVRPRFKDVLDVGLLLRDNPWIDSTAIWPTLAEECSRDCTPLARFNGLLDGSFFRDRARVDAPYRRVVAERAYFAWRTEKCRGIPLGCSEEALASIYVGGLLPATLDGFLADFAAQLCKSGFSPVAVPASSPPATSSAEWTERPAKPWWRLW